MREHRLSAVIAAFKQHPPVRGAAVEVFGAVGGLLAGVAAGGPAVGGLLVKGARVNAGVHLSTVIPHASTL